MKQLVVLLFCLISTLGYARAEVTCDVQRGTSGSLFASAQTIRRSVEFATGRELNRATRTSNYTPSGRYALLWFSQSEVAILEPTGFAVVAGDFELRDVRSLFTVLGYADFQQVNGSSRTNYRITCRSFSGWIDARLR